jgi:hypothetical protein
MVLRVQLACLASLALLSGCAVDTEFTLAKADLPPVVMDQPMVRWAARAPKDIEVDVLQAYRGMRGGVLLLKLTNAGMDAVEFVPRQIGVQLSSGYRHRFMTATEFESMCQQFGAETYGIGAAAAEVAGQWLFPEEEARYVLQPGQSKEIALAFGAQPQEGWLTLDFDPAWKGANGGNSAGRRLLAVALPDVLPPKKPWLPEWLHFGFFFSNAG